ncbi:MAG: D-alanyl-D-alanine carboxypeptidase [Coxiellaceae bacterium]|nr:D-alanyl-D-alanine carboxypeptidase [Coxiellaceae bacterium]
MKNRTNRVIKRLTQSFLSLFVITSFSSFANQPIPISNAAPAPTAAKPPLIIPAPPRISAKAYVLMDANSGAIIAQKNMQERLPPASLTKLMTLYVTSEALAQGQINLDDKVHISKEAWSRGGSRMFLKEGSYVSIRELIQGIIVASGNDACVAIAQYIGGSETGFARMMNDAAKRLGMTDSHFVDSTGLPKPGHYTTAYDLATLTRALINQFPQYYGWYKQKWIKYNKIKQPNRNRLLWRDPSVDGLKTGHTDAAGYCLIASALRHGMRLISVVMGTPSDAARSNNSQLLLNWGYRYYRTYKLFQANTSITKARVWLGKKNELALGITKDMYVTIPAGEYKSIQATIKLQPKLRAPIVKGQVYGEIEVNLKGKTIAKAPLIALNGDPRAGWLSRTIDHIGLFFKNIF